MDGLVRNGAAGVTAAAAESGRVFDTGVGDLCPRRSTRFPCQADDSAVRGEIEMYHTATFICPPDGRDIGERVIDQRLPYCLEVSHHRSQAEQFY